MKNQTDRPASGKQLSTSDMQNKAANLNSQSRPNNIITDEKGNVLRNSNGQWQEQNNGQWQDRTASAKTEKAKSSVQQRSGYELSSSIDRQQHSRQRTTTRMQSPSRPSRSSFGGGGGRR